MKPVWYYVWYTMYNKASIIYDSIEVIDISVIDLLQLIHGHFPYNACFSQNNIHCFNYYLLYGTSQCMHKDTIS